MPDDVKAGDLVAVSGRGPVSWGIQLGTLSVPNIPPLGRLGGISHVGVVVPVFGELLVYESTSFDRPQCVRTGRTAPKGVQAHYLSTLLEAGGKVWHYPLRRELYFHEEDRLLAAVEECLGRDYDFFGAGKSWGGLVRWTIRRLISHENAAELFCSELVAHAWTQVGLLHTRNTESWNPNRLCRAAVRRGICDRPELLT